MEKDTCFYGWTIFLSNLLSRAGHAPDNIIIWFEKEKILYGGCLIKSVEARDLGNLSDANIKQYATTIRNVQ